MMWWYSSWMLWLLIVALLGQTSSFNERTKSESFWAKANTQKDVQPKSGTGKILGQSLGSDWTSDGEPLTKNRKRPQEDADFDELTDFSNETPLPSQLLSIMDFREKNGEILAPCFGLWPLGGSSTIIYDYVDDGSEIITGEERKKRRLKLRKRRKRKNRTKSQKNKKKIRAKEKVV